MAGTVDTPAAEPRPPLSGLYDFVKAHLLIVNAVVTASVTVVGLLDFLAPTLSVLPKVVYSCTAGLVSLMLVSAFAPALARRGLSTLGLAIARKAGVPAWRRPGWQFAVAILLVVSILGFISVAKASQGGVIASSLPAARSLQESLLGLRGDVAVLKSGVDAANATLGRIAGAVDPVDVADRCTDLECAVEGGASPQAVRRLFDKGVKTPGNPINDGNLLWQAAVSNAPGRLEVLGLLFQHGIDRDLLFMPTATSKAQVTTPGLAAAREISDTARLDDQWAHPKRLDKFLPQHAAFSLTGDKAADRWNDAMGCLTRSAGGVSLMELAALQGDGELFGFLAGQGDRLPQRPLACRWQMTGRTGAATVHIDPATGRATVEG